MLVPSPRRVLLIANGEPPSRSLARTLAARSDYVVAADGGANFALRSGIRPDLVVGDLDSITPATRRRLPTTPLLYVSRQDNTDLEKALDLLAARGVREVELIGAAGRRLDFTLGNLSVLWNYTAFLKIRLLGDGWYACPVQDALTLKVRVGTVVSLIPFGVCEGITLRGFQYGLTNATMRLGEIGVSNVARTRVCTVRLRRGNLLVIVLANPPKPPARHGNARTR